MPRASYVLEYADEVQRLRALHPGRPALKPAFQNVFSRPFTGSNSDWLIRLACVDEVAERTKKALDAPEASD